jgi:hypothetical protein
MTILDEFRFDRRDRDCDRRVRRARRGVRALAADSSRVAEKSRLTVLHVDKDFELIAGITGQETHRLQ